MEIAPVRVASLHGADADASRGAKTTRAGALDDGGVHGREKDGEQEKRDRGLKFHCWRGGL